MPILSLALALATTPATEPEPAAWTILFYGAADNSCEQTIVADVAAMAEGFVEDQGVELVVLLDRSPRYESAPLFGEDFAGTRLFRIRSGRAERLSGGDELPALASGDGEVDVGDARTLASFVRFGKARFPARRTALVIYSHGDGRAMCADESSDGDELFPAEITAALEERDSVDLLAFDVCSMAGLENAYEWRRRPGSFGADAMVASAPVSGPWPYAAILRRLCAGGAANGEPDATEGGTERDLEPSRADGIALARLILEEKRDQVCRTPARAAKLSFESWCALDLARAADAKAAVDRWAAGLEGEEAKARLAVLRGYAGGELALNYVPREPRAWTRMPFFDAYELARRDRDAVGEETAKQRAQEVCDAVDALVSASFGLADYPGFEEGRHGAWILFPDGDAEERGLLGKPRRHWQAFTWYSPDDVSSVRGAYGRSAWCRDGRASGAVGNWHQRLESL